MPTIDATAPIEAFWRRFQAARPDLETSRGYYEAFSFGDDTAMADELAALVANGVKTATSSLLWSYEDRGVAVQREGDFHVVVDARRAPVCVIQTTELWIARFEAVDARFAFDYGEGERTLDWWRENLWAYYAAVCASLGREPTPSMPLVCERFAVVFSEAHGQDAPAT